MEKHQKNGKITVSNFEVLADCVNENQAISIFPDGKYIYVLHLGYLVLCYENIHSNYAKF